MTDLQAGIREKGATREEAGMPISAHGPRRNQFRLGLSRDRSISARDRAETLEPGVWYDHDTVLDMQPRLIRVAAFTARNTSCARLTLHPWNKGWL